MPAVDAQHQRGTRQVQQVLRREHVVGAVGRAAHGQPGAVAFGEGHLLAARDLARQVVEQVLQRVRCHDVAHDHTGAGLRQAQFHHLQPQAVGHGHEIAAGIGRAADAARRRASLVDLGLHAVAAQSLEHRRAKRCAGLRQYAVLAVAPLDAHDLGALAQQGGRAGRPGGRGRVAELQGLQALKIAREAGADVVHRVGRVAVEPALDLACFVTSGQPDQRGEQRHRQRGPQGAPPPVGAPALNQAGRSKCVHRTRCSSAGSCARQRASTPASSSASTTASPSGCTPSTRPQGSTSMV